MEIIRELIQRSKSWTMMTDVRDVLYNACDLLEHFLQIDAGYFLYSLKETNTEIEYSWGLNAFKHELNSTTDSSDQFLPQLQSSQGYWTNIYEAPSPWREISKRQIAHTLHHVITGPRLST